MSCSRGGEGRKRDRFEREPDRFEGKEGRN